MKMMEFELGLDYMLDIVFDIGERVDFDKVFVFTGFLRLGGGIDI